jgi:prolyl oligopeptidase
VSFRARFCKFGIEAVTTLGAPLGRIVSICPDRSEPSAWVDIVPQTGDVIYGFDHCNDSTVVHYLDGRFTTTRVYSGSGKPAREILYPQDGTVTLGQVDQTHNRLFYSYSNFTTPTAIYTVDLASGESVSWWQPGASRRQVKPQIESHTFTAKDGVPVAISLVRPKGTVGPHSLLLSAYGGGAVSSTPKFSALLTILLEAGFSFATAHVRGGGEGGQQWHVAAQRQRKQISVDDLIGAAEWLIDNRHSTPQHLGVAGQSNGALLTLCAIVQQPQLFRAALAIGPIADLTRFHLFGVARGFVTELGSPDNPEEFAALYRLSPYHGICRETRYPAALVISGDCDKRCDSLHARKMIAQLRETASSQDRILLDYTEHRGHKPALPLTERIRSLADRLTFLIAELSDLGREERTS